MNANVAKPLIIGFFVLSAVMASQARAFDLQPFVQQAVLNLVGYLQTNTVNPPGNESRGVAYLSTLLDEAGIEYEVAESAPGQGNLWAKLSGTDDVNGRKAPLVLLHHIDVVPANADYWRVDPFSGDMEDGYVYGRGAIDTKGLGIVQLQAFWWRPAGRL